MKKNDIKALGKFQSEAFDRMRKGESKYGDSSWKKNDMFGMLSEELLDASNYIFYEWRKLQLLMKKVKGLRSLAKYTVGDIVSYRFNSDMCGVFLITEIVLKITNDSIDIVNYFGYMIDNDYVEEKHFHMETSMDESHIVEVLCNVN